MKRNVALLAALLVFPQFAVADSTGKAPIVGQNNIGTCGWGSKLFDGQKGVAPQVLAVTTNGTSGNQTFAITSGTSGCTQDGVVKSAWKTAAFIDANMNRLALDASRGEGESLASLASLMEVAPSDRLAFQAALKSNFGRIFADSNVSPVEVAQGIATAMRADAQLSKYSSRV